MNITTNALEDLGFKDQTGGWGSSQGSDSIYKKRKPPIEIQTVDFDNKWHLTGDFKTSFSTIEDLDEYCIKKFGVGIKTK